MVNLIANENMKLYRRTRTWIMIGLVVAIAAVVSFVAWYYGGKGDSDAWRQELETRKQQLTQLQNNPDRRAAAENIENEIALIDYRLAHDIRPAEGTLWAGLNNTAGLVGLITVLAVIAAGESMAGEFSSGTIKLLLIRPANRTRILLSKYVSLLLFGVLLLLILFVAAFLINGLLYGFGHLGLPALEIGDSGEIVETGMLANLWRNYLLNGVSTVMYATMAFMISVAFRSSAMAIGITLIALFIGQNITYLLQSYWWSKYLLFANIDLSGYLYGHPFQEGMTPGFSVAVLAVYFLLFHLVAWLVFTRRDVAA